LILYRTAGAWGPGTGANLSAVQVDGNFYDLATRVRDIELHPAAPTQITAFNAIGNQLYIHMSDGTVQGPLTLPVVRWRSRGQWQPSTVYSVDDVIVAPDSSTYLVMVTHTSGTTFAAGANDGQGHTFYSLLLQVPSLNIPAGGANGAVLTKNSPNSYDLVWRMPGVPDGGVAGQVLQKYSNQNQDAGWSDLILTELYDVSIGVLRDGDYLRWSTVANQWVNQPRPMLNVLTATSWAPVTGDEGSFLVLTNGATATTIRIPNNSTQAFPVGSELHVHQDGTGPVTIVGETGVTLRYHAAYTNRLLGQYATATVKKTNTNEWRLFGLLAGA
jgi:hypothetical protein